jgi:hypothetical protein
MNRTGSLSGIGGVGMFKAKIGGLARRKFAKQSSR